MTIIAEEVKKDLHSLLSPSFYTHIMSKYPSIFYIIMQLHLFLVN
jgi:hypothetical protein